MKKVILILACVLGFTGMAFSQTKAEPAKVSGPQIQFVEKVHDYGDVTKGGNGECVFVFKNVGTEPLLLSQVSASCGCTTPSWTRDPIMPQQEGRITVKYNTQLVGSFNKSVTVVSNSVNDSRIVLQIKGTVKE